MVSGESCVVVVVVWWWWWWCGGGVRGVVVVVVGDLAAPRSIPRGRGRGAQSVSSLYRTFACKLAASRRGATPARKRAEGHDPFPRPEKVEEEIVAPAGGEHVGDAVPRVAKGLGRWDEGGKLGPRRVALPQRPEPLDPRRGRADEGAACSER